LTLGPTHGANPIYIYRQAGSCRRAPRRCTPFTLPVCNLHTYACTSHTDVTHRRVPHTLGVHLCISYIVALRDNAKRWLQAASGMMDSHLHVVSGVSSCVQRNQDESEAAREARIASETRRNNTESQTKRGDFAYENHPTRQYLPRTQARSWSYQSVDVVSPIDATGHPQLARVLRLGA
jgi:hypothetical protein